MDDMTTTSAARARRLPHLGWGALLAPVMALSLTLWGVHYSTLIVVFVAASIWYLAPAVAADLLPIALVNLGVHWIIWAVDLAKGNVTVPSGGGIGGLLTNFQSIASTTQATGNGARFIISEGGVAVTSPNMTSVAIIDATAGLALVLFGLWLVPRTVGVHTGLVKRNSELSHRVAKLTETRIVAVDTAALELRRVERDLHDGAQARLVALGIALRAAEGLVKTNPDAATALLIEARQNSAKALAELRDLVRGVHPPVLADRGLADAVRALALNTPIRTETDINVPGRLDPPVESACYFAIAEALTNAVKHSGARLVQIRIRYSAAAHSPGYPARPSCPAPGLLRIEVTDDGTGGADPARGSGLQGVERRLGTFDGILAVSSPVGGPTIIVMEIPCALSSRRTSSC
jgi:signal transduction histidine kinase